MLRILAILLVLLASASAAAQSSITLRRSAVLAPAGEGAPGGVPVTLGQIADLSGPDAERLAGVVVLPAAVPPGPVPIELAQVRAALAKERVNWARVTLSGSTVSVRFAEQDRPASGAEPAAEPKRTFSPAELAPAGSVHQAIADRLAGLYDVPTADLRLRFPSLADADARLLAEPAGTRRVDVHPGSSSASGRVPLRVELYRGDRLERSANLSAEVRLRRAGFAPASSVARGQSVDTGQLQPVESWLSPGEPAPLGLAELADQTTRRRLEPGRPITSEDLASPVMVNRGDIVLVHCLSGGVVVKAKARALNAARDGEPVKLQLEGGGKAFTARVNGRGRAVMSLDEAPAPAAETPTNPASSPGR
jgi:flagella basal body P-ring formation protein FlgA